jgi:hypothetical protein
MNIFVNRVDHTVGDGDDTGITVHFLMFLEC